PALELALFVALDSSGAPLPPHRSKSGMGPHPQPGAPARAASRDVGLAGLDLGRLIGAGWMGFAFGLGALDSNCLQVLLDPNANTTVFVDAALARTARLIPVGGARVRARAEL